MQFYYYIKDDAGREWSGRTPIVAYREPHLVIGYSHDVKAMLHLSTIREFSLEISEEE